MSASRVPRTSAVGNPKVIWSLQRLGQVKGELNNFDGGLFIKMLVQPLHVFARWVGNKQLGGHRMEGEQRKRFEPIIGASKPLRR